MLGGRPRAARAERGRHRRRRLVALLRPACCSGRRHGPRITPLTSTVLGSLKPAERGRGRGRAVDDQQVGNASASPSRRHLLRRPRRRLRPRLRGQPDPARAARGRGHRADLAAAAARHHPSGVRRRDPALTRVARRMIASPVEEPAGRGRRTAGPRLGGGARGRGRNRETRDDRRAIVPVLRRHPRQPRAQQHHGDLKDLGPGHELRRPARRSPSRRRRRRPRTSAPRSPTGASPWARATSHVRSPGHGAPYRRSPTPSTRRSSRRRPWGGELNSAGQRTGKSIAGAVTITLTDGAGQARHDRELAVDPGRGNPDDPVLNSADPNTYGFGALRCAIDNLNGDNVEWIAYPTGARACVLLRLLRQASAHQRDDHRAQGSRRPVTRSPAGTSASWATSRSARTHRSRSPPRPPSPDHDVLPAPAGPAGTSPRRCRQDGV